MIAKNNNNSIHSRIVYSDPGSLVCESLHQGSKKPTGQGSTQNQTIFTFYQQQTNSIGFDFDLWRSNAQTLNVLFDPVVYLYIHILRRKFKTFLSGIGEL